MDKITIIVKEPTVPKAQEYTKEDVFGTYNQKTFEKISNGMVVASSGQTCPIFKDKVPYKSVTVICPKDKVEQVIYWLEYVHGGDSVSKRKDLPDGKVALRSDYRCW